MKNTKSDARLDVRVHLYAASGVWIRTIGAREAAELLRSRSVRARRRRNGRIREIELTGTPGRPIGPPTKPSIASYMGRRYTYLETIRNEAGVILGHTHRFRPIHCDDQALYLLAITDCGGVLREARQ